MTANQYVLILEGRAAGLAPPLVGRWGVAVGRRMWRVVVLGADGLLDPVELRALLPLRQQRRLQLDARLLVFGDFG